MNFATDKKFLVILSTAPSREEGKRIAHELLERRLVACVNIIPGVESIYRWKGSVEEAAEVLLLMKTERGRQEALLAAIQEIHGYEVPEALILEIAGGLPSYLDWVSESLEV